LSAYKKFWKCKWWLWNKLQLFFTIYNTLVPLLEETNSGNMNVIDGFLKEGWARKIMLRLRGLASDHWTELSLEKFQGYNYEFDQVKDVWEADEMTFK
jgi:hypothetical protein